MESWLTKAIRRLSQKQQSRGTPGSPGGGEIGTPVLPDAQCDLFIPPKSKKRRKRHDDQEKQPRQPAGRAWNDTAQM